MGLLVGWLLTINTLDFLPESFFKWVSIGLAGSELLVCLLSFLPFSADSIYEIQFWVLLSFLSLIPIMLFTPIVVAIHAWSGHARLIIYSSLVYPLFMPVQVIYILNRFKDVDTQLAQSFWNISETQVQGYFLSASLFIVVFILLNKIVKLKFGRPT